MRIGGMVKSLANTNDVLSTVGVTCLEQDEGFITAMVTRTIEAHLVEKKNGQDLFVIETPTSDAEIEPVLCVYDFQSNAVVSENFIKIYSPGVQVQVYTLMLLQTNAPESCSAKIVPWAIAVPSSKLGSKAFPPFYLPPVVGYLHFLTNFFLRRLSLLSRTSVWVVRLACGVARTLMSMWMRGRRELCWGGYRDVHH